MLSSLLLVACGDNGASAPIDGSGPADAASADAAATDAASPDARAVDAASPDAAPDAAPPARWARSFTTGLVTDPAGDDDGDGDYLYPEVGGSRLAGVADLRQVRLAYDAQSGDLTVEVGLTTIDTHTRVAVILLDHVDGGREWTIGGTEIRVPAWGERGVQLVLADPAGPLFDFGVSNDLHPFTDVRRPDNVVYTTEAFGGAWMTATGEPSTVVADALRLPVSVDRTGAVATLTTRVSGDLLARHLDTARPTLYAIVYSYLLIDPGAGNLGAVEFGALELTPELGGLAAAATDPWRDADVYDLAFVDGNASQDALLSAPASPGATDDEKVVVLASPGAGVKAIPLAD